MSQTTHYGAIMEAMRQSWTDDRLDNLRDDLNEFRAEARTDFTAVRSEMRAEFAAVRSEMKTEFAAVRAEMRAESGALRAEMAAGFGQIHERFDRLFQAMIGFGGLMTVSLIGFIATQL
jgi:AcrR family transcriptional regulator